MFLISPKADRAIERVLLAVAVILVYALAVINIGRGWLW